MPNNLVTNRIVNSTNRPLTNLISNHLFYYPTPSHLNYNWSFGSLVGLFFALQIVSGIFLAMHYTPHIDYAFASVEHIMTDVNGGYLFRYFHANGAFDFSSFQDIFHIIRSADVSDITFAAAPIRKSAPTPKPEDNPNFYNVYGRKRPTTLIEDIAEAFSTGAHCFSFFASIAASFMWWYSPQVRIIEMPFGISSPTLRFFFLLGLFSFPIWATVLGVWLSSFQQPKEMKKVSAKDFIYFILFHSILVLCSCYVLWVFSSAHSLQEAADKTRILLENTTVEAGWFKFEVSLAKHQLYGWMSGTINATPYNSNIKAYLMLQYGQLSEIYLNSGYEACLEKIHSLAKERVAAIEAMPKPKKPFGFLDLFRAIISVSRNSR